jgi:hypothetical protein
MPRYSLRTLLKWVRDNDCLRVQITLLFGCFGVMIASGIYLYGTDFGRLSPSLVPTVASSAIGILSAVAIAEGVWKLDN